jgi:hypothetical protein
MTFLGTFCVGHDREKSFLGVKRDDRICDLCDLEHTGDEFHYLFECTYFERERKQLLPNIQKSNVLIYHDLLNNNDIKNCIKIAKFCTC